MKAEGYLARVRPDFGVDAGEDLGIKVSVGRAGGGGDTGLATNLDAGLIGELKGLQSKPAVDGLENKDRMWGYSCSRRSRVHCGRGGGGGGGDFRGKGRGGGS